MAAYAAHLTRTRGGAPSVFQLVAQEALADTVKPALERLVEYLSATHPASCGWLRRWFHELYLLLDLCLQYHYLKHYAASFSESFYGLTRTPLRSSEWGGARLPAAAERASLLALAVAPYLAHKITQQVDKWREMEDDGQLGKSPEDRLRSAAIRIHSIAHLSYSLARLTQLARYLSGSAKAHCPILTTMGLTLSDAPPPDHQQSIGDLGNLLKGRISEALSFPLLSSWLLSGVQWGAFALQCLRSITVNGGITTTDVLPPPPTQPLQPNKQYRNKCPLCLHSWRIPTVLPVSGMVFCYVCISRHVRAHHACPVTRCPAAEDQLLRMYVD